MRENSMMKIHLDTDLGGDMDDVCALALLLKWPNAHIMGVTTVAEENGRRAGYTQYVLNMMGRSDIPLAAGADLAGGYFRYAQLGYPPEDENWPEPVAPCPGSLDAALDLLKASIEQEAILIGIGPYTNFMLLDKKYPGILKKAKIFLMGGNIHPSPPGYPSWKNEDDWNIQVDVESARYVLEHAQPTVIPVSVTSQTALRGSDLPRLAKAGHLGELLVRQAEVFARTEYVVQQKYAENYPALPRDIINFHHDPLACAIALGWREGVQIETVPLKLEVRDTYLHEIPDEDGIPTQIVTKIDSAAFNDYWCDVVCG
jgi:purine nucleosidase